MCGRYTLIRLSDFTDMFPWIRPPDSQPPPRFNIAPSQPVAVVPNVADPQVEFFQWGLIPSWARDPAIGSRLINARLETATEKPAFRNALRRRRCLIPASGFYEWKPDPDRKSKTPMYIRSRDGRPFAFAGLWDVWRTPEGQERPTCAILTGRPNDLVAQIHGRMPVILLPELYRDWLAPREVDASRLIERIQPYPAELLEAYPVSRLVNSPGNDGESLIAPAGGAMEEGRPGGRVVGGQRARDSNQPGLF
ncbi:MAG: SOS response-associated peptidase [Phycisphaerae bacterium]|nr:SOS response-associated peptidase [Phycisphaerae bacterium]MDW8262845.1 SOS response-associated peptidase [Phycisphaerales bacterium]